MRLTDPDVTTVASLLRDAARAEILPRASAPAARLKGDGSWVTDADVAMQRRVERDLAALWPHIPLLGEEMTADRQAALLAAEAAAPSGPGLWVLDPLDGTSNFAAGLPVFGPSLALLQGGQIRLGVVYDVMRDELFSAALGGGARCNGEPLVVPATSVPLAKTIACVDFKRLSQPLAARLATQPPYASQRSIGSVALDWCWVAAGRFHLYLHGSQGLWDYAAGHLILAEAGGHSATLSGEPAFAASLDKRSAVCAGNAGLFAQWTAWLAQHCKPD